MDYLVCKNDYDKKARRLVIHLWLDNDTVCGRAGRGLINLHGAYLTNTTAGTGRQICPRCISRLLFKRYKPRQGVPQYQLDRLEYRFIEPS